MLDTCKRAADNKIYVLVLITLMDRAGAETMMMNYLRNIDRRRIQIDFLVNRPGPMDYEQEIQKLGSHIYRMSPILPGKFRKYQWELKQFLERHPQYQILYSHLEERSYLAMRVAEKMNLPVRIVHAHSIPGYWNLKYPVRLYFRKKLKKTDFIKAACGIEPAKWLFGSEKNVTIIKNAVDAGLFSFEEKNRKKTRKALKIQEDTLVIGHIGRFCYEKNHEFLLHIFAEVRKQRRDSVLLLVGGGKPKKEIETRKKIWQMAKELGVDSGVKFLGIREDIPQLLQAMDILVMPSRSEGFPMTLVEAQAAGTRCLVSDRVAYEINMTGEIQFASLEEDPVEWANKLLSFCQTEQDRSEMNRKVRDAGYDIHSAAKEMEALFENAAAGRLGHRFHGEK